MYVYEMLSGRKKKICTRCSRTPPPPRNYHMYIYIYIYISTF